MPSDDQSPGAGGARFARRKVLAFLRDRELAEQLAEAGRSAGLAIQVTTALEAGCQGLDDAGAVLLEASFAAEAGPVLRRARASDAPVLVAGTAEQSGEVLRLIEAGARGYVPLPEAASRIVERLGEALSREEERRRGALRIERAKSELQAAFDAFPQALVVVGPDLRLRRVNRAALELSGMESFGDLLGRTCPEVFGCGAGESCPVRGRPVQDAARAAPAGEPQVGPSFLLARGLQRRTLRCQAFAGGRESPVPIGLGDGILVLVEDITERAREEAERTRAEQLEAVWLLAATLSHEINQPLGAIMGRAQLGLMGLERGAPDAAALKRDLNEIVQCVHRIVGILDKLHRVTDIVTKPYLGETRILDLDRSAPGWKGRPGP